MSVLYGAPFCPAGHPPHKGGDQLSPAISPITSDARASGTMKLPISPLVGEMFGRPEGGARERKPRQGNAS